MAGFVPSPNTVAVKLHWTIHGRPQLNVLHGEYVIAGPLNPNIAQNIFGAISAAGTWGPYAAALAITTSLTGVGVLDLRSPGIPEVLSTGLAVVGAAAEKAVPDQVSVVLTLRTGLTGKSNRGRIYTLGMSQANVDPNGLIDAAFGPIAVAWHNAVKAAMAAQSINMAIRSPALPARPSKPGGTLPAKDFSITPVTTIELRDNIFDTNRRRTDQLKR